MAYLNLLIGLSMGLNLLALGSSRLPRLIRAMSAQGVILGVLPLIMQHDLDWQIILLAVATVAGKGVLIPTLLRKAMRTVYISRELEPLIGFVPSILLGAVGAIFALAVTEALPLLPGDAQSLLVPAALATMFSGVILLVGRSKAISQVCGYLILENGIYLFGLLLVASMPLTVEAGVLLDLTAGVFIIGIVIDRIQRAFDSLDTRKLTALRE